MGRRPGSRTEAVGGRIVKSLQGKASCPGSPEAERRGPGPGVAACAATWDGAAGRSPIRHRSARRSIGSPGEGRRQGDAPGPLPAGQGPRRSKPPGRGMGWNHRVTRRAPGRGGTQQPRSAESEPRGAKCRWVPSSRKRKASSRLESPACSELSSKSNPSRCTTSSPRVEGSNKLVCPVGLDASSGKKEGQAGPNTKKISEEIGQKQISSPPPRGV